ncbi:kumamolisin [Sorangium cellulosum]|uniref:Kumamolisin n=1 Tax=Sorangium cellulosum TaxID=56 RepID=A0A4P2PUN9_SORCE|nr:S53 family serine peptidase [Sorangium cellulosum]AUX20103.1 kumamolisin [Sorangium cellulosum]
MRSLSVWCGALLALSGAACAEDDGPVLASGLPRPLAGVYFDFGPAPTDERFRALMAFSTRDVEALERTIDDIYDPTSPSFRQYMSVETWMERHAPDESDIAIVEGWLVEQGMEIKRRATNRLLLEFTGTVEQFNIAFDVELRDFERENPSAGGAPLRTYGALSPLRPPQKIIDLAAGVAAVEIPADTAPLAQEGGSIETTPPEDVQAGFAPAQIARAYAIDALHDEEETVDDGVDGFRGQGVKLGVVAGATFKIKDLQSFWRSFGISRDNPKVVVTADPISTRYVETTLDTQWAGAMAPKADLVVYEGPDARTLSILYAWNEAIAAGEVSVLSTSFAHREETEAEPIRQQYHASSRMGAALGMTIVVASGDSSRPDVPSSSPYVTCVGGTLLELGADGEVEREAAWSGSGSGRSRSFTTPWWQEDVVKDAQGRRAVSDVALNASPEASYWLYYLGKWERRAGTSFAAPVFAGLMATVNSRRLAEGKPVAGWLNPALYLMPEVQAAFRDITTGKTPEGFSAGPGWDYPTGWGAPLADRLAAALP